MESSETFQMKSVWRIIIKMSIPSLISVIVMLLYNMADMYFIGWTRDYSQVAAIALVMPAFTILMAISTMLGNGGCTLIAQAFGKGDAQKAKIYSSLCIWGCFGFGVLFMILCFAFTDPILNLLGADQKMWMYAKIYLLILAFGAPVVLLNHTLGGIIRGEGAVKEGMYGGLLATVVNVILDPLFIIKLHFGVGGAAAATVLGNMAGVMYYVLYKKRRKTILTINICYAKRNIHMLGNILALGMPNAVSSILAGFASTFGNRLLVQYGTGAVAAMAAAGKVTMIITMIQMGICMGIQPMLAYCHGAKDIKRMNEVMGKLRLLTLTLGISLGIVGFAWRYDIVGLFIQDTEVLELGGHMVTRLILTAPLMGLFYRGMNYLQASGRALWATIVSGLRQGVILIPMLYIMNDISGMEGILYAHVVSDAVSIIISLLISKYCMKHEKELRRKSETS